jgi:hypothetical protein
VGKRLAASLRRHASRSEATHRQSALFSRALPPTIKPPAHVGEASDRANSPSREQNPEGKTSSITISLWPRAEGETLAHNERSASVEEQAHIGIIKGSAKRGRYTKGTASLDHKQADVLVDHRKQETRRVEQEEENGNEGKASRRGVEHCRTDTKHAQEYKLVEKPRLKGEEMNTCLAARATERAEGTPGRQCSANGVNYQNNEYQWQDLAPYEA